MCSDSGKSPDFLRLNKSKVTRLTLHMSAPAPNWNDGIIFRLWPGNTGNGFYMDNYLDTSIISLILFSELRKQSFSDE